MNLGKMDVRCKIERKSVTTDPTYGTEVITWTTVTTCWAAVQDALPSKSEAVRNGLTMSTNQTRLRMRYRTDLDSTMRMTLYRPSALVYQIVAGPAELGDHEGLEFMLERYSS